MTKPDYDEECQKSLGAYIPNQFRKKFFTPFHEYVEFVGKPFVVLGPDKKASKKLEEFEYMYRIRFEDGTEMTACGEEVCLTASDPNPVLDSEIIGESPDGRPILKLEDGTFQVQPHDDNYWITIETLDEVQEAYQHPENYPNPWDTPMQSFPTGKRYGEPVYSGYCDLCRATERELFGYVIDDPTGRDAERHITACRLAGCFHTPIYYSEKEIDEPIDHEGQ